MSVFGTPARNVSYFIDPAWDSTAIDQWHSALALWSAVANITFTQAQDQASADFRLIKLNTSGTGQTFPNLKLSDIGASEVNPPGGGASITVGTDTAPLNGLFETPGFQGGDSYFALVHELGHLIGLGHAGPYNASDDPNDPGHLPAQFSVYDMQLWSILSYVTPYETTAPFFNGYPVTGTGWGTTSDLFVRLPTTPMMLDILAAQRIYGRPTDGPLVDGNDVFGFNVHLGDDKVAKSIERYFDFTVNKHPVITIWDGGFNNTLDLSGWSTPSTINLKPGTFSSGNGQINNIGIAFNTIIETAKGGEGSDTITGNAYPNFLFGNGGNDNLNGGPGNDALTGGLGADRFVLGKISDGVDTFLDFSRIQQDRIALDHAGFDLGSTGTLAQVGVTLVNGSTAQDSAPTILYSAGDVSWDSDGTGANPSTLLAHVLTEDPTAIAPGPIMVNAANTAHVFPQLSSDDFVIV